MSAKTSAERIATGDKADALEQKLKRLEGLLRHVPGVLFQYQQFPDGSHCVHYVSENIEVLIGISVADVMADPCILLKVVHDEDINTLIATAGESLHNLTQWQQEFRVNLSGQNQRCFEAEATPVKLEEGGFLWCGYVRDVSERTTLEMDLREAQEGLMKLVEERTQKLIEANVRLLALNAEIQEDIVARIQLEKNLKESHELLSLLAADLVQSEERERRRIATELHDDVVQDLALAKLRLDMGMQDTPPSPVLIEELIGVIIKAVQRIRHICNDLSPPVLYDLGLSQAIQSLGESLLTKHHIDFELKSKLGKVRLLEYVRTVLYQTVRELLVNVVKHARATGVVVNIRRKYGMIEVSVVDDGVGFSKSTKKGFGLSHVQQRIEFLKGNLKIESTDGKGTVVIVAVPVSHAGNESLTTHPHKGEAWN